MFAQEFRIEDATRAAYDLPLRLNTCFAASAPAACLLEEGKDYQVQDKRIVFAASPGAHWLLQRLCMARAIHPRRPTAAPPQNQDAELLG